MSLSGLYVISDDLLTPKETLLYSIEESLRGGAKIVQLRDKSSSDLEIKDTVLQLEELCREYNALFVMNDRVDLAIDMNLSGLHIGKSDYHRVKDIRENFKGVLGVSCYGDIDKAKEMQDIGVDYVAFGSFFSSKTKPNPNIVPLDTITKAKNSLTIPICVIGGISTTNIDTLLEYKPDMVALINDIWSSDSIESISKFYSEKLKEIL